MDKVISLSVNFKKKLGKGTMGFTGENLGRATRLRFLFILFFLS
jgi:hypothetical protein